MQIRKGTEQDIPAILSVLKASLGETSSRKTEEVWRYKHVDNPFGSSLVLLAEEAGSLVGVRAFMRWRWQYGGEVFSAFRAVDTATHPDHQGKGIFKKLTLRALEVGKEQGDHFVFNTPNSQSRPGYLKMGWKEVGKLSTSLRLVNPYFWKARMPLDQVLPEEDPGKALLQWHNQRLAESGTLFTPKDPDYLRWRYMSNPLQEYQVISDKDMFLAGYVKTQGKFRELRIVEAIGDRRTQPQVRKMVQAWAKRFGVHFISFSPASDLRFTTSFTNNFGPILTMRNINLPEERERAFMQIGTWAYSLGDLELF